MIVQGQITSIKCVPFKDMFRHEIVINGKTYSVYKKSDSPIAGIGTNVTVQITNETAGTAKVLEVQGGAPTPAPSAVAAQAYQSLPSNGAKSMERDTSIIRQTCVKAACELYSHQTVTIDIVVATAKRLESFVLTGE